MKTEADLSPETPADTPAGEGLASPPCSPLDVSDLVAEAIEERRESVILAKRRKEIEEQIEALQKELKALPDQRYDMYLPEWRVKLDKRIEDAILSSENDQGQPPATVGEASNHHQP